MIEEAGFAEAGLMGETGYKSSPATMGMLFFARKPA